MYANGAIPLTKLVHVGGNVWLPAGTLARWNWAVAQAKAKYGVTLRITGQYSTAWNSWNGYRPYTAQVQYRQAYGVMAAMPGYSSHGGTYRGQEVFAIDVDNWAELGWARFVSIMRLAGFTVDFVSPREQWHVGDFNDPWVIPGFASGGGSELPLPVPTFEEDDMLALRINAGARGTHMCTLAPTVFSHMIQADNPEWIKDVVRSDDRWTDVPIERLPALLHRFGCDLHIWDIRNGAFVVLNPLTGEATSGGMWSAVNAARSAIAQIPVTSKETAAYIAELAS